MVSPHSQLKKVTDRVIERSKSTRSAYLARIDAARGKFPARGALSCANSRARLRGSRRAGKVRDQGGARAEHRHCVFL